MKLNVKKKDFIHFKCINAKAFYKMKKLIMLRIKVEDVGVLYLKYISVSSI